MALTDVYDPCNNVNGDMLLQYAYEQGIRYYHTAFHYGNGKAYSFLNSILSHNDVKLVVKIMGDPLRIIDGLDGIRHFFNYVNKDTIDYMQLVPTSDDFSDGYSISDIAKDITEGGPLSVILSKLHNEGKYQHLGIEVWNENELQMITKSNAFSFIVSDHSVIRRVIHSQKAEELLFNSGIQLFAIRPLASGWLTNNYVRLTDFSETDRRKEWYYPGEELRRQVQQLTEKYNLNLQETCFRFLKNERIVSGIVIGMSSVSQITENCKYDQMLPLDNDLYIALKGLFQQPIVLEP